MSSITVVSTPAKCGLHMSTEYLPQKFHDEELRVIYRYQLRRTESRMQIARIRSQPQHQALLVS